MKKIKRFFAFLLAAVLAVSAVPSARAEERPVLLPIVMYHHMSEKAKLLGDYVISPDQFERDLVWLRDNGYETVTAAELAAWRAGQGRLPPKPVMITFDDGFESTGVYALPLLEKYGMTGVLCVIGSVAQQYSDRPDHMLDYSHLSWEAAAEIDAGGVLEIGCHTDDMHRLKPRRGCGRMAGETAEAYRTALTGDLETFEDRMERAVGRRTNVLALPFGFYSGETLDIAASLGFQVILTCSEQVNRLTGRPEELLRLGRWNRPSGPSSEAFFSRWADA